MSSSRKCHRTDVVASTSSPSVAVVSLLVRVIEETNELVKLFGCARDLCLSFNVPSFSVRFFFIVLTCSRQYKEGEQPLSQLKTLISPVPTYYYNLADYKDLADRRKHPNLLAGSLCSKRYVVYIHMFNTLGHSRR
ncbi:hypothetical protein QVD17_29849 [Tagetes erecta]|uniref:Uncharacterized protein n=1 Tax=Tagetes erecta TaxID=13708 RepID=A0AAD8NMZ9_TARER|nr:hypothetical protein QVD17_29849 [Tagetes erecta]